MVPPEPPRIKMFHLTFGREFTAAVEAKQVASQETEKAKLSSWWRKQSR